MSIHLDSYENDPDPVTYTKPPLLGLSWGLSRHLHQESTNVVLPCCFEDPHRIVLAHHMHLLFVEVSPVSLRELPPDEIDRSKNRSKTRSTPRNSSNASHFSSLLVSMNVPSTHRQESLPCDVLRTRNPLRTDFSSSSPLESPVSRRKFCSRSRTSSIRNLPSLP